MLNNDKSFNKELNNNIRMPTEEYFIAIKNQFRDFPCEVIHFITLCKDDNNDLYCLISLFLNELFTYMVKISNDASKYLSNSESYTSIVYKNGNILSL